MDYLALTTTVLHFGVLFFVVVAVAVAATAVFFMKKS